jgi:lipoyl(octanoyl) transferase
MSSWHYKFFKPVMNPETAHTDILRIRELGLCDYEPAWHAMREFTDLRQADTPDEIWYLQHPSVFTMGLNAKAEHLLNPRDIPVINIDRGGQVTYHGPGQLIAYLLLDLNRLNIGVKQLVFAMEQSIIDLLSDYDITAERLHGAPGIYVAGAKIAALGLRIRRGFSYHGLALNIDMDLEPFTQINPCGYAGMPVTQLATLAKQDSDTRISHVQQLLHTHLLHNLGYNEA